MIHTDRYTANQPISQTNRWTDGRTYREKIDTDRQANGQRIIKLLRGNPLDIVICISNRFAVITIAQNDPDEASGTLCYCTRRYVLIVVSLLFIAKVYVIITSKNYLSLILHVYKY